MVLGSGCFDGLHSGHARYLAALKKLAQPQEEVCVAVAPDDYIDAHKRRKPHWPQSERWRTVAECGVTPLAQIQMSVAETIRATKPRLFIKGAEWAGKLPADVQTACKECGVQVVYVEAPGTHTTEAIG